MDAEALFLESRREREESRAQRLLRTQKVQEKRHRVSEILKARLTEWTQELEQIMANNLSPESEEEKRNLRMILARHEDKLKQLRKECLSTDSLSSLLHMLDPNSTSDEISDETDEALNVSDVGIFHTRFSECQSRLDRCRKEKLPRGKFLFNRYRQALEKYVKPLEDVEKPVNKAPATLLVKRLDTQRTLSDLQGLKRIIVKDDGSVEGTELHKLAASPASLVLHNIKRCSIELRGFYPSLHLMSVIDTTITIINTVDGAIHVTDCHNCSLQSTCQQLRLHGSTGIECHVLFKGGAILEDCSRVSFWKIGGHPLGDIRDFNWLKHGIPSPNFSIEEESLERSELQTQQNDEVNREQGKVSLRDACDKISSSLQDTNNSTPYEQDDDEL